MNWFLYGIGRDCHTKRLTIVIQIREYEAKKINRKNMRKSYFIIGRNDDQSTYAYSVGHYHIYNAIRLGKDVVYAVQNWMFRTDYKDIKRQGRLGVIPISGSSVVGTNQGVTSMVIQNNQKIMGDVIHCIGDEYFVKDLELVHLNGKHSKIEAEGWSKVYVCKKDGHYCFAAPTLE